MGKERHTDHSSLKLRDTSILLIWQADEYEEYFPQIEAVILFGEPVRWETNLQLIIDLLMTKGKPDYSPSDVQDPHIPILACNMDMVWMAEACMPR